MKKTNNTWSVEVNRTEHGWLFQRWVNEGLDWSNIRIFTEYADKASTIAEDYGLDVQEILALEYGDSKLESGGYEE